MATVTSLHGKDAAADPLRAALAAAIEAAREAREAVARQRAAIEKTRSSIVAATKAVQTAQEGVEKAREAHAQALADAAATADAQAPASGVRAARQIVEDKEDELSALKGALAQLKAELPSWENAAREADIAVEATISAVLAPHAHALLERAAAIARDLSPLRGALLAILSDHPAQGADVVAFEKGRVPLSEVQNAARSFFHRVSAVDDKQAVDPWLQARERLRADPFAALSTSGFVPPPPNAVA